MGMKYLKLVKDRDAKTGEATVFDIIPADDVIYVTGTDAGEATEANVKVVYRWQVADSKLVGSQVVVNGFTNGNGGAEVQAAIYDAIEASGLLGADDNRMVEVDFDGKLVASATPIENALNVA